MKEKKPKGDGGILIPFPRLPERLLEKAVNALKTKQHKQALDLFKQLSETDPYNPQASYGLAVCYVELGQYDEAEVLTKEMMEKDIGNYYDVLKLHITVLIQQKKYDEVVRIVDAVLEEGDLPTAHRQNLLQLSEFARRRLIELPSEVAHETPSRYEVTTMMEELENGNQEQQWSVFQQANELESSDALTLYNSYFMKETGDPLLKSMMLRDLKERGLEGEIMIKKIGRVFQVDLADPLFYEKFADEVHQLIHDCLSSDNPTLLDHAIQLWGHFILSAFPLPLLPEKPNVWAAACYVIIHEIHGQEVPNEKLIEEFSVTRDEIRVPLGQIRTFENNEDDYTMS